MVTCANCANNATYTYTIANGFVVYYCDKHLPSFARKQGLAVPFVAQPEAVVTKSSKKTTTEEATVGA
jgi:hypothetical protein